MISDLPITGFPLFHNIDHKLSTVHRELKFIARTLARLRHRHHAALVFSSKRSANRAFLADFQHKLSQDYATMLRRIFGTTPKKVDVDDIESCPSTPTEEVEHPLCLTPGYRTPSALSSLGASPLPSPMPSPSIPGVSRKPLPRTSSRDLDLDTITLIVDEQSQAIFDIPRRHIASLRETQEPETVALRDRDTEAETPITGLYLRKTPCTHFHDFAQWTKTGRILQYPHNNAAWVIEHHARRLVDALALGVNLKSLDYQCAAVSELHTLGPALAWPEDYVNGIFAATSSGSLRMGDAHPARRLIVAIVAAKTCGEGKRRARQGARDRNIERGDRIGSGTFWKMYDRYCEERGMECAYPDGIGGFMR